MQHVIKVLVVDDSAFVRKAVREMLCMSPLIEVVGTAKDGGEALQMVHDLKPDVVTCDLVMPGMDGVAFVVEQMRRRPLPILIVTSMPQDGERALEAMEAGAVDIVQKPTARATDILLDLREELIEKVKAAASAPIERLRPLKAPPPPPKINLRREIATKIVVIGISTGGPQALRYLVPQFPADFPVPIAVVLHMPVGYTAMFAARLNEISRLRVSEAKKGDPIEVGTVLFAPAGQHLLFKRDSQGHVIADLSLVPVKAHRPSVDVLFQSAVECYGTGVLGVVMTGMGDDGKQGAAWIKAQGGDVLTQSEQSCVIYGMPRSVVEAGLSDAAVPLEEMVQTIGKRL